MQQCQDHANNLKAIADRLGNQFQTEMKTVSDDFSSEINDIADDLPDTEGVDATLGIEFDVEWEIKTISLHLPEVEMSLQSWHFDLPSVSMKDERIVFHTPSTRMVRKKVGQYPEVHGFTVKWKDIYVDVPEVFMQRQELVMGIPQITMQEQNIKMHVPEFSLKLQEMKLHLPKFILRSIEVASEDVKRKTEATSNRFKEDIDIKKTNFFNNAKDELIPATSLLFSCHRTQIQNQKENVMASFEPAILQIRNAISKLESTGAGEATEKLKIQLNDVIKKQQAAASKYDIAIENMIKEEKKTVDLILSTFSKK